MAEYSHAGCGYQQVAIISILATCWNNYTNGNLM